MKIALAQKNFFVGNIQYNKKKILDCLIKAQKKKINLLIFPELSLNSYHPLDMLKYPFFLRNTHLAIKEIHQQIPEGMMVLVGAVAETKTLSSHSVSLLEPQSLHVENSRTLLYGGNSKALPTNSVFLLQKNTAIKVLSKEYLADYDVFDEKRYFQKDKTSSNFFSFQGAFMHLLICEDMWQNISLDLPRYPHAIISVNASPFTITKHQERLKMAKKWVKKYNCYFLYTNLVGGQEELIFDGGSFVLNQMGQVVYQEDFFKENLSCFNLSIKNKKNTLSSVKNIYFNKDNMPKQKKIFHALIFGLTEFVHKNKFKKVHLGISGGLDSAVVATLACEALGSKNVKLFFIPGPFTSILSKKCVDKLVKKLQCSLVTQTIEDIYKMVFKVWRFSGDSINKNIKDIVKQNVQARLRNLYLMAIANQEPESLLLGTSNKSELAMGYGTLYGDLTGGLLPIGDLLKTELYSLAQFMKVPAMIRKRPASAELAKDQKDEDDLPPYKELDLILRKIIEEQKDPENSLEKKIFYKVLKSEFKRKQTPPILKIKDRSFDRGWRMPFIPFTDSERGFFGK